MKLLERKFSIWALILAALVGAVLAVGCVYWGLHQYIGRSPAALRFYQTLTLINKTYVGDYTESQLFEGATKGMVDALGDPYSVYLDKKTFGTLNEFTDGSFGGIGVVVGKKDGKFVVVAPLKDTPGAKAGVKAGDQILAVDGESTAKLTLEDVVAKIRGKSGTEVELTLQAEGENRRTVKVVRGDIKLDSVKAEMIPGTKIGYIQLYTFNESTGSDFIQAYRKLEGEGMQATLLDLRENPGGLLSAAVRVCNMLVPKGPVVSITDVNGHTEQEMSGLAKVKYPLAVLVDHGSASASEIVAGAIQDTDAGRLFGTQTFGKGVVQSVYKLTDETGLKLTTAHYYTPKGRDIHKKGITPDEIVEQPKDVKGDVQYEKALAWLKEQLH